MGRNPCIGRPNEGEDENKIYLIKSKGGVVKLLCLIFQALTMTTIFNVVKRTSSRVLHWTTINVTPSTSGLFYRYCLSRNHTGNPGPGGVCLTGTKQQDSCIIIGPTNWSGVTVPVLWEMEAM